MVVTGAGRHAKKDGRRAYHKYEQRPKWAYHGGLYSAAYFIQVFLAILYVYSSPPTKINCYCLVLLGHKCIKLLTADKTVGP